VRIHLASACCGVNSVSLGTDSVEQAGASIAVRVRRKIMNTAHLEVGVPAATPACAVDPEVAFMPLVELANLAERPTCYTIIGAGKIVHLEIIFPQFPKGYVSFRTRLPTAIKNGGLPIVPI
jgi:hypothetical protein